MSTLAYELCKTNDCSKKFKSIDEMAWVNWVRGFLKLHPIISVRNPEVTTASREMGFSKVYVSIFLFVDKCNR
jgi:hypothetical protein